jgi:hypothetical protein
MTPPTAGERHLGRLLDGLNRQTFFYRHEPRIVTTFGSGKPDFVVIDADRGVLVIEVKDWRTITGVRDKQVHIVRVGGEPDVMPDPVEQAERYAHLLKQRFEQHGELWETHRGRTLLKFPYQVMVALPNIPQETIARIEEAGIWPHGVVAGREKLASSATLFAAVRALPWRFIIPAPLTLDVREILREVLDPSLMVTSDRGRWLGILTLQQEAAITLPLARTLPRAASLFPEDAVPAPERDIRRLKGVAGSGKTLVLARRASRLRAQHPDQRILVLSFNRLLAADLNARLHALEQAQQPPALLDFADTVNAYDAAETEDMLPPADHAPDQPPPMFEVATLHRIARRLMLPDWETPIKTGAWLGRHAAHELEALGLDAAYVSEELAWRREMGLLTDEAYLDVARDGRHIPLTRDRRALINTIFNRYEAYKAARRAAGETWYDFADTPRLALERLLEMPDHPYRAAYDAIFIDEAQDFAPSWMRLVNALLKPDAELFLCDDEAQTIFTHYTWIQRGVTLNPARTITLEIPFRSTHEVSAAAHALIGADPVLSKAGDFTRPNFRSMALSRGPAPAVIVCDSPERELAFIEARVAFLREAGVPPEQIAVLLHDLSLRRWGLRSLSDQGVFVDAFSRMKGLEFTSVFIPDVNGLFPDDAGDEDTAARKRRLFTAMTRARRHLFITCTGGLAAPLAALGRACAMEAWR